MILKILEGVMQSAPNAASPTCLEHDKFWNSTTIHERNFQFIMAKIFKTIKNENPPFLKEIFVREDSNYNMRCMFRLRSLNYKEQLRNSFFDLLNLG